ITQAGEAKAPDALADRAAGIVERVSPGLAAADRAYGFLNDNQLVRHIEETDSSKTRWDALSRLPAVVFWYRSSPRALVATTYRSNGTVGLEDPRFIISGMTRVQLDGRGRLIQYEQVPPQRDEAAPVAAEPDFSPLLEMAGADPGHLQPAAPVWNPLVACDR